MKPIIFKVHKAEPITGEMLRINDNIREYINILRRETGWSATAIVEKVLEFAVENHEIREV